MKPHEDIILDNAIAAMRDSQPESAAIHASADRIAGQLGIASADRFAAEPIQSCHDIQRFLPRYHAGTLSADTALLVKSHLRECGACLRLSSTGTRAVDWSVPAAPKSPAWHPRAWGLGVAITAALVICGLFIYDAFWAIPPGVRAQVQSINGSAYLVSVSGERPLAAGYQLHEGERLRTTGSSRAVIRLMDGSTVELNERSAVRLGARGRDFTVSLDHGAAIVQAAKRTSGHLYLKTPDCRVAVTGTVFSVDSGLKGSRVAVLQGTVHVVHAGIQSTLNPGDQITTNDNLAPEPLEEQVSWSQNRDKYIALVAEIALLGHRIQEIPFPQPRYGSDLLTRVPADTLLYVSIPNLGEFLSQADTIFNDQLKQSPELNEWWSRGKGHNTAELDELVQKLHDVSQYIGDEVVVAGWKQGDRPGFAVLADVQKSGLADLLRTQFTSSKGGITVFDEKSLQSAGDSATGPLALVRDHEVVFSNSVATLRKADAQLNAGASGFASSEFGKQIGAAYNRGLGIVLAANVHEMAANAAARGVQRPDHKLALEKTGLQEISYLIAEHRETNGVPQNHLNVQFSGTRQRVASWLAAPAPIGALDFVTPNASIAFAVLSKDPASIADDIIAMSSADSNKNLDKAEQELQINIRQDLIANIGGEFLLALDGPALPTPSWKAVLEVHDSGRLEATLEQLVQVIDTKSRDPKVHQVQIEPSDVGSQRYYAVRDVTLGTVVAVYTYSGGYMIIAPDRALLIDALRASASGDSLGHSASFRALLPKDGNENYSAIAYQNLSPVLSPLLSQLSGEAAEAIRKLAADSHPTAICAWGEDTRIEVASDSRLFGFDFLTLGALMDKGNKFPSSHVKQ